MRRKKLGEYIRLQRKIRHMSLNQLASMCATSVTHISRLERGVETMYIDLELLHRIASSLHVPIENMLIESGYIEKDEQESIFYQDIETFLQQPNIKEYYQIHLDTLDENQKQEVYHQLLQTLDTIAFKYSES